MSVSAVEFIAELLAQLNDETGVYWEPYEVQGWVNQVQRTMCLWKRDSYVKTAQVSFVAGPKQTLPADGISLVDVIRNGAGFGGSITRVDYKDLPRNWPDRTCSATEGVKHYMYNPAQPVEFYVFPNYTGATLNKMEIVYSAYPPVIDVYLSGDQLKTSPLNPEIVVRDVSALHDGVMGRCCLKQTGHAMADRAQAYLSQFSASLGNVSSATAVADPNASIDKRAEDRGVR